MLPIGVAIVLLALVAVGLRAAGGRTRTNEVVEVPARLDPPPSTTTPGSTPSPSTTQPGGTAGTRPGTPGSATTKLDTTTPKVKVTDVDGRFEVTVPRSWVSLPGIVPDSMAWQLFVQDVDGEPLQTEFQFVVKWFASGGCDLEQCAAEHVERLRRGQPALVVQASPDMVAGNPAVRLEASLPAQRVVDWVVVKDDRYWVVQLIGPLDGFEEVLSEVQPVLATMSFG